jgi:hypothetical protein
MTKKMNLTLKLEELGQFLLSIVLSARLEYHWWVFAACIMLPDISMAGYLFNARIGAWLYNLFHHKLLAAAVFILGVCLNSGPLNLAGLVLFAHAAMDRFFGYGLKFDDSFKNTHLGRIGRK